MGDWSIFYRKTVNKNRNMILLTNVYLKWVDLLNLFSFFSYHYTIKVEWLLLSVPPKIRALLPQWEMSLRGRLADTLLPVSEVPWASKQMGAERCWPGPQQDWKVWANEAICQDIVPTGPGPATCLGGPLASTHGEADTHPRVQICLQARLCPLLPYIKQSCFCPVSRMLLKAQFISYVVWMERNFSGICYVVSNYFKYEGISAKLIASFASVKEV